MVADPSLVKQGDPTAMAQQLAAIHLFDAAMAEALGHAERAVQQLWFTLFSEQLIQSITFQECLMNHWAINLNSHNVYSQHQYCLNNPQGNN